MLVPHAASTGLSTGASTGTASFDQIAIVTAFVALMYVGLDVHVQQILRREERTGGRRVAAAAQQCCDTPDRGRHLDRPASTVGGGPAGRV